MLKNTGSIKNLAIGIAMASVVVSCYTHAGQPARPSDYGNSEDGALIIDDVPVPVSEELTRFMAESGYVTITLTRFNGQEKIVDSKGQQIEPCGFIDGVSIKGNCNLQGISLMGHNSVETWLTSSNPTCLTKSVWGRVLQFHVDTRPGQWRAGQSPCHPEPHAQ